MKYMIAEYIVSYVNMKTKITLSSSHSYTMTASKASVNVQSR